MSSHKTAPVIPDPKGYESADIDLTPINKWMVALLVFVLVNTIIVIPIYLFLLPKSTVGDVTRFDKHPMPESTPVLQALPKVEMRDFHIEEQAKAEGYGWADKSKGEVRIPIEKAMELVVEKGADGVTVGNAPAVKPEETTPLSTTEAEKPLVEANTKQGEEKHKENKEQTLSPTTDTKPAEATKKSGE